MSTTTTSLRTLAVPGLELEPRATRVGAVRAGDPPARRAVLREILRLVDRAGRGRSEGGRDRTSSDSHGRHRIRQDPASPGRKARRGSKREAIADDEKRRRAIVDAAIDGETQGQGRIRRRQPQDRHAVRQRARRRQERIRNRQERGRHDPRLGPEEGRQGERREEQADRG